MNDECEALHVESTEVIALIETYAGCNEAIRDAMSNPKDDEIQRRSFMALVPNIQLVKRMHDHGQEIGASPFAHARTPRASPPTTHIPFRPDSLLCVVLYAGVYVSYGLCGA